MVSTSQADQSVALLMTSTWCRLKPEASAISRSLMGLPHGLCLASNRTRMGVNRLAFCQKVFLFISGASFGLSEETTGLVVSLICSGCNADRTRKDCPDCGCLRG